MDLGRKLFDEMPTRDVVSWNAVITGYWKNGYIVESKRLFDLMPIRNVVSWNSMIAGCVENGRIDAAFVYFSEMPEKNIASWNVMISGFIRHRRIEEAVKLFEQMPRRNVISYTAMIDGYAQKGDIKKARDLFESMPGRNEVSWTVMISAYVESDQVDEAREVFGRMPYKNVVAMTAMITGYCKEGKMEDARMLFEEIQSRDDVSFNAMITGYAQNGRGEEALRLLVDMIRSRLRPDQYTLVSILAACSSLASLTQGKQTHALVFKNRFDTHVSVGNALITMYSKCGCLTDFEAAFEHISCPNIVSWNTIIAAFAQHGLYEKALCFFKKIELHGIEPDGITFLSLLSAFGHAGMVKESLYWFDSMKNNYNLAPRSEHYACLIDILGRSGHVENAYKMILKMPFEADLGVWGSLLAGCRFSLNIELAELAAQQIMKLDPKNSGAYVMLSNIYAASNLWRKVTEVRRLMKENQVKKQTAFSWMEINNIVHYFVGGDASHLAIPEIHMVIVQLYSQMKGTEDIA
ncbi:pentatricopeptide repeat-containing protein At1g09410, mitochondrial-like [Cynara cardunculus var. scolymus]|uniref:pentatricopeptide repeat-containing protein At1g09410, mitochondrial-like n=1 Tax=Cynara cardunculus var. scolymus TaxID=59895 RepID=UPI000D62FB60|nr:pentatricopeptide repeat-containing protein At1g09410, mitochondrial-like [Cynara cardunculus var. scolymus]